MMNPRNAPLSPVSVGGSEWSVGKYGTPNENINSNDYFQPGRGQFISPPNSGGPNGTMNGFPPGPRSLGGPSPPPSIGRQSNGTYGRPESSRGPRDENWEGTLGEHYLLFRTFLNGPGRQGKPPQPPNKARDKLLRLTLGQFLELSTDVYDELRRRQDLSAGRSAPDKLQEEDQFHEKRNEARGKLKFLSTPRFRDLATDVFLELERRFPRFASGDIPTNMSPNALRRPSRSNTGTPVGGFPPRAASRMRRPSDASSVRSAGPPGMGINGGYAPGPISPSRNDMGLPERPLPKQMATNTIVPNKSTMVEEDEEGEDDQEPFGVERGTTNARDSRASGITEPSAIMSEADKKLLDEYQMQVRDLREKLDKMEDDIKRKDDEICQLMDVEHSRTTKSNVEKKEWEDARVQLEEYLADARAENESLKDQLERMKNDMDRMSNDNENELRDLRKDLQAAKDTAQHAPQSKTPAEANRDLFAENQELRMELQEQQRLTEEVRKEAQQSLREMKTLIETSGGNWEKQAKMEKTIEQLEQEVRDWKNRYAKAKTQLRNMRGSSMGLAIDQDATQYVKEKGFTEENGLVKDVHVTKFQIAIDEFLRGARLDNPEKVTETMKSVVISVRRITKDIDQSVPRGDELAQQRSKLKGRVSSTANNLITAAKNFANSAGLSPVSLLDAAASHLVAAVVELLRNVKIRVTPIGELEEDDDGTVTPVGSTPFFSPRSTVQAETAPITLSSAPAPPPPFQGLGGLRASVESSAYSSASLRESVGTYTSRSPDSKNGLGINGLAQPPEGDDPGPELSSHLATIQENISSLVDSIRDQSAPLEKINEEIDSIGKVIGRVIQLMESSSNGSDVLFQLQQLKQRLFEAGEQGQDLASLGRDSNDREWSMWKNTLPPIAFGIARELKELLQRVDQGDDFS